MKAVIETGGKQYIVAVNDEIYVEKLDHKEKDKVVFEKVLMIDGKVGNPYLKASVEGTIIKNGKQKKLRIFRYVPKSRSTRKTMGHRQPYTKVKIDKIIG